MRTTLSLDDDVAAMLDTALRREQNKKSGLEKTTFKEVVNMALRRGLEQMTEPEPELVPFRTSVHDPGECFFPNLDKVHDILEEVEGPWHK